MVNWNRPHAGYLAFVVAASTTWLIAGATHDDAPNKVNREISLAQADEATLILKLFCRMNDLEVRYQGPCGGYEILNAGRVFGQLNHTGHWLLYQDGETEERRWLSIVIAPESETDNDTVLFLKDSECRVVVRSARVGFNAVDVEDFHYRDGRSLADLLGDLSEYSRHISAMRRTRINWELLDAADGKNN